MERFEDQMSRKTLPAQHKLLLDREETRSVAVALFVAYTSPHAPASRLLTGELERRLQLKSSCSFLMRSHYRLQGVFIDC